MIIFKLPVEINYKNNANDEIRRWVDKYSTAFILSLKGLILENIYFISSTIIKISMNSIKIIKS